MKELNNNNKLVRAAGTMKDVLNALNSQIDESQHRTDLLKSARRAAQKSIKSLNRAARDIESAKVAFQAVDDWDNQNTPGVIIDSPDSTTDTDCIIDTEAKRQEWNKTLSFLFNDPDLQD